jgi:Rieske 2Fe-2S family protein
MTNFHRTSITFRQGSRTMPGEFYTSPDILAEEQERIFARQWLCVGRSERLARPGDYVVRTLAGESLIVLRDRAGAIRAFFNVCRHRGTRICMADEGLSVLPPSPFSLQGRSMYPSQLPAKSILVFLSFVVQNISSSP